MAQKLLQKGYKKVFALKGGWDEWVDSEYPLEKRDPLPGEEQSEELETSTEDGEKSEEQESESKPE